MSKGVSSLKDASRIREDETMEEWVRRLKITPTDQVVMSIFVIATTALRFCGRCPTEHEMSALMKRLALEPLPIAITPAGPVIDAVCITNTVCSVFVGVNEPLTVTEVAEIRQGLSEVFTGGAVCNG